MSRLNSPLRWKGFVEKVGFERGVKEWRSDQWCTMRAGVMRKMSR